MKKYISIIFFLLTHFNVESQVYDGDLLLTVTQENCVLKISFKNKSKKPILIPDFSLRSHVVDGRMILLNNFVKITGDTLKIDINQIKDESEHSVIVGHGDPKQVVIKYNDIELKEENIQYVRLGNNYCIASYSVYQMIYNGQLLGQYVIP